MDVISFVRPKGAMAVKFYRPEGAVLGIVLGLPFYSQSLPPLPHCAYLIRLQSGRREPAMQVNPSAMHGRKRDAGMIRVS